MRVTIGYGMLGRFADFLTAPLLFQDFENISALAQLQLTLQTGGYPHQER